MIEAIPKNLNELSEALCGMTPVDRIVAGGTDLVIQLNSGRVKPGKLIFLGEIPELKVIEVDDDRLRIGSAVTMDQLANCGIIPQEFVCILQSACDVGSHQIRCKATLGGNIAGASPAADMAPILFMLNPMTEILSSDGTTRLLPVCELITGPGRTSLRSDEAIISFIFSRGEIAGCKTAFVKLGFRSKVTISRIGLSVAVELNQDKTVSKAKIMVGAISLTPVSLAKGEALMVGRKIDSALAKEVAEKLSELIMEITPEKFDRDYKVSAARGIVEDAFNLLA